MSLGITLPTNVTIFPAEPAIAADREKLDNLGGQISTIIQEYKTLRDSLATSGFSGSHFAKFDILLTQRRQAIEAAMDAWKVRAIQVGVTRQTPMLQGLGQLDLATLQTQITGEQSKLAALQSYYAAYKAAVESGQAPPAMPPELQTGFMGISTGTIIAVIALLAGAGFLFMRK